MRWYTLMISCAARDPLRRVTIERLARTDWAQQPLVCFEDPQWTAPLDRHRMLVRSALEAARRTHADMFLFLEDDILFNRHLRHNLETWAPVRVCRPGDHVFGSLFNPGVQRWRSNAAEQWFEAEPLSAFGSQGIVVSRATLQHMVSCWGIDRSTHGDLRLIRLASLVGPILYHQPSLIQHDGRASLWGGPFIEAQDFDPDWRA